MKSIISKIIELVSKPITIGGIHTSVGIVATSIAVTVATVGGVSYGAVQQFNASEAGSIVSESYETLQAGITPEEGKMNFDSSSSVTAEDGTDENSKEDYSYPEAFLTDEEIAESAHVHSYSEEITSAATCLNEGSVTYTCSCGESYVRSIPLAAHTPGDWVVIQEPDENRGGCKS